VSTPPRSRWAAAVVVLGAAVLLWPADAALACAACGEKAHALSTRSSDDRAASARVARLTFQPRFPIQAAFYYPWYPETWTVDGQPIHFHPTLGLYSTDTRSIRRAHIRALRYARLDAAISAWKPPPHYRNARLKRLLATTVRLRSRLRWSIYYSPEGHGDPDPDTIAADLRYVRDNLATSPAYLRVRGRFVVFVWSSGDDDTCDLPERWRAANDQIDNAAFIVLKVFGGYGDCVQPNGWHQYGPAVAVSVVPNQSFAVSPGFWKASEAEPRLKRNLRRFRRNVRAMKRSQVRWQLVTTFNEWGEGTAVESAREWRSASHQGKYLDALRKILG
jgi:hypothetical protein